MNYENIIQWHFIAIFVLGIGMITNSVHKAWQNRKKIKGSDGLLSLKLRLVATLPIYILVLLAVAQPDWFNRAALPIPLWGRFAGIGAGVWMLGIIYWTFSTIDQNTARMLLTREFKVLFVDGPYRWVRHPLDLSEPFLIIALGTIAANGVLLGMGILFLIFVCAVLIPREDIALLSLFGVEYHHYMCETDLVALQSKLRRSLKQSFRNWQFQR